MNWNELITRLLEIPEERRNEKATFTTGDFYDETTLSEVTDLKLYTKVVGDPDEDDMELGENEVPTSVMLDGEEELPYPDTFILSTQED